MNIKFFCFFAVFLLSQSFIFSQNRIDIQIPSIHDETSQIWRTIRDIKFFEEHNYPLNLPSGQYIESLKEKSRNNQFSDKDYSPLFQFVETEVYKKEDYHKGYDLIEKNRALINKMANTIIKSKKNWEFKEFPVYTIKLTLYGSGGNYNPDDGSIIILTTPEGKFRQYDNPSNTLIHEIVHIGIEESLINAYKVPHPLKERMVDQIVLLNFKNLLPEYRLQDMGDYRIDPFLKKKKDLKNLDKAVRRVMGIE